MATWTAAPLLRPFVVTTAVKLPVVVGCVVNVMVNCVGDAAVTLPTAPRLKVTALLPGVGSKPNPLMTSIVEFAIWLVFVVTTGVTVATWTAAPLL